MRWLLLEEIVSVEKGSKAVARGRIPNESVSTEILLMEMMAQTGGLLIGAESDFSNDIVFTKIEKATFSLPRSSGDEIMIVARSENLRPEGAWLDAQITGNSGEMIAQSRFLLMNVGKLRGEATTSITFHHAFMNHFNVRNKVVI